MGGIREIADLEGFRKGSNVSFSVNFANTVALAGAAKVEPMFNRFNGLG